MNGTRIERTAIVLTVVGMVVALAWPFVQEAAGNRERLGSNARIITLTGVATTGTWTAGEVRAGNYFAREFAPARPVLRVGETVVLRLKSADVNHVFYSPELGIGPLEVYPGHVVEIEVTPTEAGAFDYYCQRVCGSPHFRMRGQIVVRPAEMSSDRPGEYWRESAPEGTRLVDHGAWLFRRNGCFTCHGEDGHGGVRNPNYINDVVPALDLLAESMFLYYPEDVDLIVQALERRTPLPFLLDDPPVPGFNRVLAKYDSISELLRKGNAPGKKNEHGPTPPLQMPSWESRLSDSDIDALIAYMLTLEPREAGDQQER